MRIEEESDNVGDIVAEAEVNLGFEKPCITEEELDEQEAETPFQRMDGLIQIEDGTAIKCSVKSIIRDLKEEGFNMEEIYEFISEIVMGAIK